MRRSACLLSLLLVACALPEDGNLTPRCALDAHCPAAMRCYRSYCIEDDAVTDVPASSDDVDAGYRGGPEAEIGRDAGVAAVMTDAGAVDAGSSSARPAAAHIEPPGPPPLPARPADPGAKPAPPAPKDMPGPPKPGGPGGPGPAGAPGAGPGKGPPMPPR